MTPPPPPRLGRPREFDPEVALERALEAFWTHGYDATSITDLLDATGLAKGSLYKGFGDKKHLFTLALDAYLADANSGLAECDASSETGREAGAMRTTRYESKLFR